REPLLDAVGARGNVSVHWGDAMTLPLEDLRPEPGKLVANLPYGIAATVLIRTIELLPAIGLWVSMAQREAGERLAARASSRTGGARSVLAQLDCEGRVLRAIPRTVFQPVPNVDSVLVEMRRRGGGGPASPGLRALVARAFAHRRKTLAGSLSLAAA